MAKGSKGQLDKDAFGQIVEQCERLEKEDLMLTLKIYGIVYELREQGKKLEMQDVKNHVQNMELDYSRRVQSAVQNGLGTVGAGINETVAAREERNRALAQFFEETYEKYRYLLPARAVFEKRLQDMEVSPVTQGGFRKLTELQSKLYPIPDPSAISTPSNSRKPPSRLR